MQPCATEKVVAAQFLSPCPSPYGDPMAKGIKHKVAAHYSNEVRDELLSNQTQKQNLDEPTNKMAESDNLFSALRQRKGEFNTEKSNTREQDFDAVMKQEQHSQENLSEHMLLLAKTMKEQASISGSIIKQDIKTLEKSNTLAEDNLNNLQIHSQKLRERSGWCARCWIWLVLAVAVFLFIGKIGVQCFFVKLTVFSFRYGNAHEGSSEKKAYLNSETISFLIIP